jgi:hypothetical protein
MVFYCDTEDFVQKLKESITQIEGTPSDEQVLTLSGTVLRDLQRLGEFPILNGCIIRESLRLFSGSISI